MEKEIIYLKLEQNVELTNPDVYMKDVGSLYCRNHKLLSSVKNIKILSLRNRNNHRCVVSSMILVALMERLNDTCEVQVIGETDVLVEWVEKKHPKKLWRISKIVFVCMVCFFGTSFTIMSYHNDIGINDLFAQYYEMVTGQVSSGFTILELSYSIGLAVGIIVFFNHIGPRTLSKDPTPIEVQMCKYENDVNTSLINQASKGGDTIDVS